MSIGVNCGHCFPRHRPNSPTLVSSSSSLSSIIVCSKIPVRVSQHLQFLSLHPSVLESLLIPVVFDYVGYCLTPCIILELALLLNLHIWIPVLARACSLCTAAKLFTWLVLNLFFLLMQYITADLKLLYIWFEGYSRLPSFLAFARKTRQCGLIKQYIQVRHAQGIHNVDGDKNYKAYMSPEYFDAHITPLGWQQVDNLRKHVHECGLAERIDLVITSPLLRTLQTAVGVFGGDGYTDRMDVVPLMVANAGNSGRAAISSLNCPPIVAVELCREHLVSLISLFCYKGSLSMESILAIRGEISVTINSFFLRLISHWQVISISRMPLKRIESDEDTWWKADVRETKEEVAARGQKFLNWLWTRKEKEIAIVTHSGFLFHTLSALGNDCHPLVKKEICKHFANCELRSMVIVDRSMIGFDPSTTNYPGKIPSGLDLPSDVVDEKADERT
ncbi:hypothetical protein CXB51_035680 [Gossypium anomalum]|uniref:Phosphoglycerate mutase-like protein 1 n=1 Tax=Gossypium anomalum TaxID=47600 RepID=A0A8J5Y2S1_9ROSI|nr:hypothetical protein CXB51_035680 [Gossypium anomalum]